MRVILEKAHRPAGGHDDAQLIEEIREAITPIDVAGLSKPNPQHWYSVNAADLLEAATKVDATSMEIEALLQRCGFHLSETTRN
jgi:hypothetical protein